MPARKISPLEIEIQNAKLKLVIEAEFDLTAEGIEDNNSDIEDALDSLRRHGSANIVDRKIVGIPKGK